jgi:hypothetical protein
MFKKRWTVNEQVKFLYYSKRAVLSICPAKINKWDTDGGVNVDDWWWWWRWLDDSSTFVLHSKTTTLSFDNKR